MLLGVDGISDFNALHSRKQDDEVQHYAFDCPALDGDDIRSLPLSRHQTNLACLLARRPDGIFVAPFEAARSVLTCFARLASSDLKVVSKRADRPYRAGRLLDWIKLKNRRPSMSRMIFSL